jgi:hypothetical protein
VPLVCSFWRWPWGRRLWPRKWKRRRIRPPRRRRPKTRVGRSCSARTWRWARRSPSAISRTGSFADQYADSKRPRFAGEGGIYFNYYLTDIWALEAGLDFAGKGFILKFDEGDAKIRQTFIDLEIPIGMKLNVQNFQVALAINLSFVISGKMRSKSESEGTTLEGTHKLSGSDWDNIRRFNIGPKLNLGYAIPLGPVDLVPGLSWSMDLIDVTKEKEDDLGLRRMNIMLVVAGEFGFDGYVD